MSGKKPAVKKANHDATASTRATIGQICVGLWKCYEMTPGQKLSVEELGDVTIDDAEQVEVKFYKDTLSDGHSNFWNTLKNWVHDDYDPDPYASLVLYTTQELGRDATLARWNNSDVDGRLKILNDIRSEFEKRLAKAQEKDSKRKPSSVYKLQEYVFEQSRKDKLKSVVEKFVIEAGCPELPDLAKQIMDQKILGIPAGKKEDYLHSLLGYVFSPLNESDERWDISYEGFHAKLEELTDTFRSETRVFPEKAIVQAEGLSDDEIPGAGDALFIQKIQDIGFGEDIIYRARRDHLGALNTINEEFSKHRIGPEKVDRFVRNVMRKFAAEHSQASRKCSDVIPDSQDFYDARHADEPPHFQSFDGVDYQFRNGVLHMQMDLEFKNLKWSLK